MTLEIAVGLAGWMLHLIAVAESPMDGLWDRLVYSAPLFAPLLFANLAIPAMIGLGAAMHSQNRSVLTPSNTTLVVAQ